MRRLPIGLISALALTALLVPSPALADGIIIPDPPICDPLPCPEPFPIAQLAIEYHRVRVAVEDQVAVTRVDQVFRNDNDWTVEGTYVFPLPEGAAVTSFTLWIDGKPVEGEVLTKEEARRTYEDIVRSLRDPALLEYIDRGAVQASIFPIEPGDTRRIELEYTQVLAADQGLFHYRYPLNTEKFSTQPLEEVSVSVRVESKQKVKAIYSPSHNVAIDREDDHRFSVGYEDSSVRPDRDFELYYSVADEDIGLSLITYRDPEEDDGGFFLLIAAPSVEAEDREPVAKDVIFVLDQSGSMDGEKFEQAQGSLRYVLDHLHGNDRFNIIAFSTGTRSYANLLRPAEDADEAREWVDVLSAQGSTDINRALLEAISLVDHGRPTYLIFLTDGLPTEGVTDTADILQNIGEAAASNVRLFAFGVGYDVDTYLLDSLAQSHHGTTTYVAPGLALDEAVSGFYAKISSPVLTDLKLDFGDMGVFDLHPEELPDLFAGSQLVLVGRYHDSGNDTIRLSGSIGGEPETYVYPDQVFRASGGPDFLPRLWATRKIGALLNLVRLKGPEEELVEQIVRLSIRYGIVTPYTSYLVTEPMALGEEAQGQIIAGAYDEMKASPAPASGQQAFERAAAESAIGGADVPLAPSGEAMDVVRIAGTRTYQLVEGVWTDTAFDPGKMSTVAVPFLSDDYFRLAQSGSDLSSAMALGPRVIMISHGVAYELVGEDEPGDDVPLPLDEENLSEDTPSDGPQEQDTPVPGRGRSLPCAAFLGPFGLLVVPMARRLGKSNGGRNGRSSGLSTP